jgi:hypothetical protein
MAWIVMVGRQNPDRDDVSTYGTFPTRQAAEEFIEEANDNTEDGGHLLLDDVEDAEVLHLNEVTA